jgi:hypothetical protein
MDRFPLVRLSLADSQIPHPAAVIVRLRRSGSKPERKVVPRQAIPAVICDRLQLPAELLQREVSFDRVARVAGSNEILIVEPSPARGSRNDVVGYGCPRLESRMRDTAFPIQVVRKIVGIDVTKKFKKRVWNHLSAAVPAPKVITNPNPATLWPADASTAFYLAALIGDRS